MIKPITTNYLKLENQHQNQYNMYNNQSQDKSSSNKKSEFQSKNM